MFCSLAVNSNDAILDPASKPVKHNALSPTGYRINHAMPFSRPIDFLLFDILSRYHNRAFSGQHS
jgi:hypothetical protein